MDENSDERINELVRQGEKNKKTAQSFKNWCSNVRISRFGGIGLVEQVTNLPIGLLGFDCDHATETSLHSWNSDDAVINFYLTNCESCDKRSPGKGPGIESIIQNYRRIEAKHADQIRTQKANEDRKQAKDLHKLNLLRITNDDLENQIVDLLCSIITNSDDHDSDALAKLASLAPETFPNHIIEFLVEKITDGNNKLVIPAARTLLTLPIDEDIKRNVAVKIVSDGFDDDICINFLQETADKLSSTEINAVILNLSHIARPVDIFPNPERRADSGPLLAIATHHPNVLRQNIRHMLNSKSKSKIDAAFRIISILAESQPTITEPFVRDVLTKLLRRDFILPHYDQETTKNRLFVLRSAAKLLFRSFPENADNVLQALLKSGNKTAWDETAKLYSSALERERNNKSIGLCDADEIAFRRVLWMAINCPKEARDNSAMRFFNHVREHLLPIVESHIDPMLGAAATISTKIKEKKTEDSLDILNTGLDVIEGVHNNFAIKSFQRNLIVWVFTATSRQGLTGVQRVLSFYAGLPEKDIEIRASLIENIWKLMVSTETVNAVIPYLYNAMTCPEPLIRGNAARAVSNISNNVRRDLPELIFEVYLVLLGDPYVYVHQSAARSIKIYDFPEKLKSKVSFYLFILIKLYAEKNDDQHFVQEILSEYVHGCLTDTQLASDHGHFIISIMLKLDDYYLDRSLDSIGSQLTQTPGIVEICIKAMVYRSLEHYGKDRIFQILDAVPKDLLFNSRANLSEAALIYIIDEPYFTFSIIGLLVKAGCWTEANDICTEALKKIDDTRRYQFLRHQFDALKQICEFEHARPTESISIMDAQRKWSLLQEQIIREEAERNERESTQPFFFE